MSKRVEDKLKGVSIGDDYVGEEQNQCFFKMNERKQLKEEKEKKTTIFLSYSRKDTEVANQIDQQLSKNPKMIVKRDIRDIGVWNSIREFMQSIRQQEYAVLLVSDAYLKSPNCMFEVLEVMKEQEYQNRIFSAIIEKRIYSSFLWIEYIKYWQNECKTFEAALEGIHPTNIAEVASELKRYQQIAASMGEFLKIATDMNNPEISDVAIQIERAIQDRQNKEADIVKKRIKNWVKDIQIGHDYIVIDQYNITTYQEKEREFIVTHKTETTPVTYFLGRETELQDLRKKVEQNRKFILVSGMGGIGKTQICKALFKEYDTRKKSGEKIPFEHIGYIEYNGNMDSSLIKCLRFKKQEDPQRNIEAAWRELEDVASNGRLLLFIDNVNVSRGTDLGLQRLNSILGAIVLTSRRTSFHGFEIHRIGFLSTEECKEIYEKIRFQDSGKKIGEEEKQDLEYIIEQLAAKHTMTIQLLAHLAQTKRWTVSRLREELEKNGFQLEYKDDEDTLINIQKSYEILYNLSELNEAEQNILEAFCVFPYLPLPFEVCNQWLLSDAGVEEEKDILTGLERKGWLQFDIEEEVYTLHPVFAQFIYQKQKPKQENHAGLIEACQKSLELLKGDSVIKCQKLIPFAESMIKKIDIETEKQADFISVLAGTLEYTGEYKKAEEWYSECLRINKDILGENYPSTASSYHNLARVYKKEGEYEKAKELYEKSLRIKERVLGGNHPSTASSYHNLAGVYRKEGEYEKAKELYEKSLRIKERVLGENHPDTASSYHNLGLLYQEEGEYKIALTYSFKAYKIFVSKHGIDHRTTKLIYGNMKSIYLKLNLKQDFDQWLEEKMRESNQK